MDTKALAERVASKFNTRDPFRIAQELGFIVICAPLLEMRGLRQYVKRRVILYVNSDLDDQQQRLVCAHELGHHFLHRGMNRLFMDRSTYMVTNKYENEAHHFSVDLIFDDSELMEIIDLSIADISSYMGVPAALAEYRMKGILRSKPTAGGR